SSVNVLPNAEIATRDLLVKAAADTTPGFSADATLDGALIELGASAESKTLNYTRTIAFNGDILMLGPLSPELEINAAGAVVKQQGVTFTDTGPGGRIIVDDILNSDVTLAGSIAFLIPTSPYDSSSSSDVNAVASLTGTPSVQFLTGFERVTIVN